MSYAGINILGETTPEEFLQTCWQKKPCLIRQAIADFTCPLSPDELAGLACEEGIDARLILQNPDTENDWQVQHGPFTHETFRQLPPTHWSLLVRHVDQYLPSVSELLQAFDFIPQWRIDDIMISYATDSGSVGPHLDSYDVFLLQGQGNRHWQINRHAYSEADFIPELDLRIIGNFRSEEEFTLGPGDMLYLPPGVAHHGVADGPCMTLSIGFLAPTCSELLQHFVDDMITGREADRRYSDPDLAVPDHAGEISAADLERLRRLVQSATADESAFHHWFGRYITESAVEAEPPKSVNSVEEFLEQIRQSGCLCRYGGIRTAYILNDENITLFCQGKSFTLPVDALTVAQSVTRMNIFYPEDITHHPQSRKLLKLLLELYNNGYYYLDE